MQALGCREASRLYGLTGTLPIMQDRIAQLLLDAEAYRALGLKPLPLDGKTPGPLYMVMGWQNTHYDEDAIRRCLLAAESPDIGIQMGPRPFGSGFIDFEHDTPAQKAKMLELFGGDLGNGPAFASRNGEHYLFAWDDRLEGIGKAVVKIDCGPGDDGLKVRIGAGGKGAQSAFPPSTNKHWLPGREYGQCELQPLPEAVLQFLLTLGVQRPVKGKRKGKARKRPRLQSFSSRKVANAFEAMLRHKPKEDEQDGSGRLLLICRCAVEHDLSDEEALEVVRRYREKRPFKNREYSEADIIERLRSAEERTERGSVVILRKTDDIGNGQRFADQHSENVRYSGDWNKWLIWDGQHWKLDNLGYIMSLAKATVRAIEREAGSKTSAEAMRKWAKESASHGKVTAMLKFAQSEHPIIIDYRDFNSHPWLYNCANGTIDLKAGELRPHRREDLLTVISDVTYPRTYEPPAMWLNFLDTIFAGDAELIGFIQRLFGVSLVGEVVEHILPIFLGGGANGKTVLTLTWMGILGKDYAMCTAKEFLMKSGERHATELAALYGKRLVVSAETDEGARLNEARVKHLTGGNIIQGRRMREDFWEFEPSHTLIMETNHRPIITGTDEGIWRRVLLVPFSVTIPPERRDKYLANKLKAEWPQILRWAVQGCVDWQTNGLRPPALVEAASREYEEASDLLAEFITECVIIDPKASVRAIEFYRRYEHWVKSRGHQAQSMTRLGERIASMYPKHRTKKGYVYKGIKLTPEDYYGEAEGFIDMGESGDE